MSYSAALYKQQTYSGAGFHSPEAGSAYSGCPGYFGRYGPGSGVKNPQRDRLLQGALTFGGSDQTNLELNFIESAGRFEPGTPLIMTAIGTAASLKALEDFGIEKIQQKNIALRDHLLKGLDRLEAKIFGTRDSKKSGPHVSFIPRKSVAKCEKSLLENKISYVTKVGGLRFSPHAFNTFEELDQALDCLK